MIGEDPQKTESALSVSSPSAERVTMKQSTRIHEQSGLFLVFFGYQDGDEFRCAHGKPSRTYKTRKGAERAAKLWIEEGR